MPGSKTVDRLTARFKYSQQAAHRCQVLRHVFRQPSPAKLELRPGHQHIANKQGGSLWPVEQGAAGRMPRYAKGDHRADVLKIPDDLVIYFDRLGVPGFGWR